MSKIQIIIVFVKIKFESFLYTYGSMNHILIRVLLKDNNLLWAETWCAQLEKWPQILSFSAFTPL